MADTRTSGEDLTARLNALREVLQDEVRAAIALASARMDSQDAARIQHLAALSDQRDSLAAQVTSLATAMQLQLDQRFQAADDKRVLLQEELDRRLGTVQIQLDQRFTAEAEARETALTTATTAVRAALEAASTAVSKSETATEKRFEGVNEFRQQLGEQAATFPSRTEMSSQIEVVRALADRNADALKDVELRFQSRLDTAAGRDIGQSSNRAEAREDRIALHGSGQLIIAAVASVIALISVIVAVAVALHK